jgi:GntR family transcriptional regulator/MocR family aminotransferase
MPRKGSTSPELHLPALGGRGRRRARLEDHLRGAVRSGRLEPGARLPSSRALAAELRVSRRLVVEAYAQLAAEGYLESRRGSGTRVAARATAGAPRRPRARSREPRPRVDLFPGAPDLSLFPRAAWGRALRAALRDLPDRRLSYGAPAGAGELRAAVSEHLGQVRGADSEPERVVATSGYQQGVRIFCELVRARGGRRIGVEDPGYPVAALGIEAAGMELVPLPLDGDGLSADALAAADPDAVVVTPAHAMPMGVVLSPGRRARLVEWARSRDALVLEDDYDAEFRYDRDPVGCLQGLAPELVVLAGTVSKTLAPALRLGWLLLPPELVEPAAIARVAADAAGPVPEQVALGRFIGEGSFDRHVRGARQRYRAKRAALLEALAELLPEGRVRGIAAGLHALVELPAGVGERAALAAAERRGVRAYALADYTRRHRRPPSVVVGYGTPTERELREAVGVLAKSVAEARAA